MPPMIVPRLSIDFPHSDWGKSAGGRYVADFRDAASAARGTWDMNVTPTESGPVTLTWDGIGSVPRTTNLTLVDSVSGQRIVMRSRSAYTFTGEAGKTRSFQVVTDAGQTNPLRILSVMTTTTRGVGSSSMGIGIMVTRPAEVTAEISALNGRMVRRLAGTRAATAGQVRLSFDGRSQDGSPLPPGGYTLTITARTDDGTTVRERRVVTLIQ
jgi:hypothetical protein